ncbi:ABC transporter related protein [Alkalidesulfovibrio alkalitolerans DSM 16529]|jgi:ABC-type polar amino acid transport system ATPase subunit|uniref:ABC transporter related protein n=1 Tax=Alkalidesulfovibrio alkalitolerans DSM 16529 TaxID=1121439 RepID=S7T964_9BACT|nr:amino acid ABC transporter ATP-binding protein [Alkalidesulfovibrio alkalitolerans]EPR33151.1 ABC transporter related protein [Alkalidesulfovibrio alkalitolerans DSM 16529]
MAFLVERTEPARPPAKPLGPVVVSVRGVRKSFERGQCALCGVDLDVRQGEVVVVIGPSGSGKSTLLRMINGLESPDAGRVVVDGIDVEASRANRDLVRRRVGMVFQHFNLFPHLSVLENVNLAQRLAQGKSRAEATAASRELLDRVGLLDKADSYPSALSGGQQQRTAIARALALRPRIMLFDEATSALDPEVIGEVLEVMRGLAAEGMTMIVVTHEMGFAREAGDRIVFMDQGAVVEEGMAAEFFLAPREERTRRFLSQIL